MRIDRGAARIAAMLCAVLGAACFGAPAGAADPAFVLETAIPIDGPVRWDYVTVDASTHRVYVAHGAQTEVIDGLTGARIGRLEPTPGVHGVAAAPQLGFVFTSHGQTGEVGQFDARTLQRIRLIPAGANPDAIVYDPQSRRVLAFNGGTHDATLIDAQSGRVLAASIPLGGKPEYAVVAAQSRVFVNIEDTAEVVALDAVEGRVVARYSIRPCESPTGIAADPAGRIYSVCRNSLVVVSDPRSGSVIGQAAIGKGPDGVAWIAGHAVSANGRDGTASVIDVADGKGASVVATVALAYGARTVAADPELGRLYFPTAEFGPLPPGDDSPNARRPPIPGTFRLLVLRLATSGSAAVSPAGVKH